MMNETTRAILRRELEAKVRDRVSIAKDMVRHTANLDQTMSEAERNEKEIVDLRRALGEDPINDAAGTAAVHLAIAPGETAHIHNA